LEAAPARFLFAIDASWKDLEMCGIVGYVGGRQAKALLLDGLQRLEYRGYDSAGIALREDDGLDYVRAVGNLQNLIAEAGTNGSHARHGLGHTRWATHGGVTERNAHPLTSCDGEIAIVLNGIIENYRELKETLTAEGHSFSSETDAETVAHLLEREYDGDIAATLGRVYTLLEGHFTIVAIHHGQPDVLAGVRNQTPLVVGLGDGECFLASNVAAFLGETRSAVFPDDGMVVEVTPAGARFFVDGTEVAQPPVEEIEWELEAAERGGYETFMLKEIYEQPEAIAETLGERIRHGNLELEGLGLDDEELRTLRRIVILACGTAYHAGVVGRYMIEEWARVPVEHDIASEWRYRNPVVGPDTLVIGISQSGETRDTISAMQLAREKGAHTLAITNVMGSQIAREVDSVLYTRAGLEISVASTKAFTSQLALFSLIALKLAQVRETIPPEQLSALLDELHAIPQKMTAFLEGEHDIEAIAKRHCDRPFFLYLGRNIGLPIALEGALKLKEISYIPTEAYSAGEMKHGPIALLDDQTPVVVVATDSHVYDKVVSNIQETRARGAHVIAVATEGNEDIYHHADDVITVPKANEYLEPMLAIVPLQLLAYRIARIRGANVDQPRNLAKTVTVE
jgi:glucosamine--fructose-6-phosphate aminotransferase (isomerizing)